MTTTIDAVYEGGVLRPAKPLPLAEGAEVTVTVESKPGFDTFDWERRIRAAKTIQEWVAVANELPPQAPGYDLIAALNENRRLSGSPPCSVDGEDRR